MFKNFIFCLMAFGAVTGLPFIDNEIDDDEVINLSHLGSSIYGQPDESTGRLAAQNLMENLTKLFLGI